MMRKLLCGALLAVAGTGTALAQGPYIGAKVAWMDPDDQGGVSFDAATNAGIMLGYEFVPDYGLAVEAEFTTSVSDGEFTYLGANGDWDIDTQAIYLVARPGTETAYFKIKAGYLNEDVSATALGQSISGDDSGFSWGLGGGYNFTQNIAAELEWTKVESDVDAWSVGVLYNF